MSRDKAIETPNELKELFNEYCEWVKENPYLMHDFKGKDAEEVNIKKQRPITWSGFESYLAKQEIVHHLGHYEQNTNDAYTDYLPIIARIKAICKGDVIDGALANVFNANIASRLEGLADKKEVEKTITKLDFKDAG